MEWLNRLMCLVGGHVGVPQIKKLEIATPTGWEYDFVVVCTHCGRVIREY